METSGVIFVCLKSKLVGVSDSTLSLFKRGQGFKPRSRMESPLWPALYPLRADLVRAGISLGCGTSLKVPLTVGIHSGPARGLDKQKNEAELLLLHDGSNRACYC